MAVYVPGIGYVATSQEEKEQAKEMFVDHVTSGGKRPTFTTGGGGGRRPTAADIAAQEEADRRAREEIARKAAEEEARKKAAAEGTKRYQEDIKSRQVQPTRAEQLVEIARLREQEGTKLSAGAKSAISSYEKGKRLTDSQLAALTRVSRRKKAEQLGITSKTSEAVGLAKLRAFERSGGELKFNIKDKEDISAIEPTKSKVIQPSQKETFLGGLQRKGAFESRTTPTLFGYATGKREKVYSGGDILLGGLAFAGEKVKEKVRTGGQRFKVSSELTKVTSPKLTKAQSIVGFGSRVTGEFIPTEKKDVATTLGTTALFAGSPTILRASISGGVGASGSLQALDVTSTPEKRVAGGITGGLGFAGATFETLPFAKGLAARGSPKFVPVKTQPKGFKAIELTKRVKPSEYAKQLSKKGEIEYAEVIAFGLEKPAAKRGFKTQTPIGLILEKSPAKTGETSGVNLPKTSPLVRGGFGVKSSEKAQFLGKEQTVATSQISFFKEGKDINLDREFFVTPQEPNINIAETRISRLGLKSLFGMDAETGFGFGFPKQPQIGIEKGASVTRSGKGGSYAIGKGTELEAIKGGTGTKITDVKKIGVTSIRGQAVELFEYKTTPSSAKISNKIITTSSPNIKPTKSAEGLVSSFTVKTTPKRTTAITTPKRIITTPTRTISRTTPITFKTTPSRNGITIITKTPYITTTPTKKTLPKSRKIIPSTSTRPLIFRSPRIEKRRSAMPFRPRLKTKGLFKPQIFRPKRKPFSPPPRSPSLLAITQSIKSPTKFRGERSSIGIRPILVKKKKLKWRKKKK